MSISTRMANALLRGLNRRDKNTVVRDGTMFLHDRAIANVPHPAVLRISLDGVRKTKTTVARLNAVLEGAGIEHRLSTYSRYLRRPEDHDPKMGIEMAPPAAWLVLPIPPKQNDETPAPPATGPDVTVV